MTAPSVEEIVRAYETAKALGLPQNYLGREYADALIADWRKRGELLREALPWVGHMSDDPDAGLRARIRAALTRQQPPAV